MISLRYFIFLLVGSPDRASTTRTDKSTSIPSRGSSSFSISIVVLFSEYMQVKKSRKNTHPHLLQKLSVDFQSLRKQSHVSGRYMYETYRIKVSMVDHHVKSCSFVQSFVLRPRYSGSGMLLSSPWAVYLGAPRSRSNIRGVKCRRRVLDGETWHEARAKDH